MTSSLRLDTVRLLAADPPVSSPLPIVLPPAAKRAVHGADAEMTAQLNYGHPRHLLPYSMQDTYNRDRREQELAAVVLENDILTATFLPGFGGRLWSLEHRPSQRELLHRNPIVQPANLALRDAWLAGGVEWNLGTTGHWPLTCSPLHAMRVERSDGTPVLRMFEFERFRRLVLQIDAWLPTGSPVLLVQISIHNPSDETTPLYWWSTAAVSEAPDVRVLAPATRAFHFDYRAELDLVDFPGTRRPEDDGIDRSYTEHAPSSADYFFDIAEGSRHWIAAVDGGGIGLAQVSTDRLRGRKLFCWGRGRGGRRWQDWLSGPTARYLEIQAGLARTQLEHQPMPGRDTCTWTEAYGLLQVDPAVVHGSWDDAVSHTADVVDELISPDALESAGSDVPVSAESTVLFRGSGWGALEAPSGFDLDWGTIDAEQRSWHALATTGRLPSSDPPASPVTGPQWRRLLEDHPADWHARYHLGLVRHADGDTDAAHEAWLESLAIRRTPWALRCLAQTGHPNTADLLLGAHALAPAVAVLTIETLGTLIDSGRTDEALNVIDKLDADQRALGRIQLLEAKAAVASGDVSRAGQLLQDGIDVPNLREAEDSLHTVWFAYHERRLAGDDPVTPQIAAQAREQHPLPEQYDFRMQS